MLQKNIKTLRKQKGLSQKELSIKLKTVIRHPIKNRLKGNKI